MGSPADLPHLPQCLTTPTSGGRARRLPRLTGRYTHCDPVGNFSALAQTGLRSSSRHASLASLPDAGPGARSKQGGPEWRLAPAALHEGTQKLTYDRNSMTVRY